MLETKLSDRMAAVRSYRERLSVLQGVWDNLSLLSQMSGDGTNMQTTRGAFEQLAGNLLQNLSKESLKKSLLALNAKAQVAMDVLVRNLFERTADIGFLCADQDVRHYLQQRDAQDAEGTTQRLRQRFKEYVAKYSVYDNVVLLAPDGKVLLQLNGDPATTHSAGTLLTHTLNTTAGYVESFGASDLFPHHAHSLLYSYRVTAHHATVGVLCLSFRFNDETAGIFAKLLDRHDWTVLTYLNGAGRVIASSDHWQVPIGAQFETRIDADGRIVRFAGREYLAVTHAAKSYQGYKGPGWYCQALLPIEQAWNADELADKIELPRNVLTAAGKNPQIFAATLQQVPLQAELIQRELNRTVWNGHIRIGARADGATDSNNSFSKVLLWEISRTGRKTQEVFSQSIGDLQQTVVSTILQDCQARAALAVDILDRNLYERANDCRWWALDRTFATHLAGHAGGDNSEVTAVLQQINQLYSVYHTLILFDAQLRVVAVSNQKNNALIGEALYEPWAKATLQLGDSQSYHASAFEPNRFYNDAHALTYCAVIRSPERRVLGGIAIVFDTTTQLSTMLTDTLSHAAPGCIAVFADKHGQVLSASAHYQPGSQLSLATELLATPTDGEVHVVDIDGTYHAVGVHPSSGYREYVGMQALAVILMPLGVVSNTTSLHSATHQHMQPTSAGGDRVELATFYVHGHWLSVPSEQVIEALAADNVHTMPHQVQGQAGFIMHAGKAVIVIDLGKLLGATGSNSHRDIVLVHTTAGKVIGLLVDELGEIPQVARRDILPSNQVLAGHAFTDAIVRATQPEQPLLLVMNTDKLVAEVYGNPMPAADPVRLAC